ncbi:hypothetical protein ACOMHN_018649 [Nucella lapillus]
MDPPTDGHPSWPSPCLSAGPVYLMSVTVAQGLSSLQTFTALSVVVIPGGIMNITGSGHIHIHDAARDDDYRQGCECPKRRQTLCHSHRHQIHRSSRQTGGGPGGVSVCGWIHCAISQKGLWGLWVHRKTD